MTFFLCLGRVVSFVDVTFAARKPQRMKPPDEHSIDILEALRRDRDRWAQTAMEQAEYIRQLEEQVSTLKQQIEAMTKPINTAERMPAEGNYMQVVQWLAQQKLIGNDYYAEADYNRSVMCRRLSIIFGWPVDQNSLRKAQNR